jgi:hypothetical protein
VARAAAAAIAALVFWFGGVGAVTLFAPPQYPVMVWVSPQLADFALSAADAWVVDASGSFLHVRSDQPGFVRDLYRAGARLVLPMPSKGGCIVPA